MTSYDTLTRPTTVGARLAEVLGEPAWLHPDVALIAGGKSNLTFELTSAAGSLILRRPPSGELLPRAHDMGREARVQQALRASDVPVPEIVLADKGDLLGVPFYVMRKVPGYVIAHELPLDYATTATERLAISDALVDTLAALHQVDPEMVALGGFGRPAGFMGRQVRTWSRQWEASKTRDVAAVDELAARLSAHAFTDPATPSVLHGDYRLDNCIYDTTRPKQINAVLDWEMSTLGDPLADLAMLLFYWCEPGDPAPVLTPDLTRLPGFASRSHLIERYAIRTGRDPWELAFVLPAYLAFAHFKFAVIAQGIAARTAAGAMAGQDFGDLDAEVARIAQTGLHQLDTKE